MNKNNSQPKQPSLTLEQANELIYKLLDRIAELEDRLKQNSSNSSRPPSSDGPDVGASVRKRPGSGKKRGAQPGHKGHRRERHPCDARLNVIEHHPSTHCSCCGEPVLFHARPYRIHQVFELPEVSYLVTEHQLFRGTCTHCIATTQVELPQSVSDTQMGPNLLSYITLQSGQFHQSISQIRLSSNNILDLSLVAEPSVKHRGE